MKDRVEKICGRLILQTFKVINPLKKKIINTDCQVHLFIQKNALNILREEGYEDQVNFFEKYSEFMDRGLVWADQDFKSYFHFYNPTKQKGMYGNSANAMTLANDYYKNALYFIENNDYVNAMAYFGASCHVIQDVTIPQHAKIKLLDNHKQFETYVKENYQKVNRFKVKNIPIVYRNVSEYVKFNSLNALNLDYMYKHMKSNKSKFYLIAFDALSLSQRTTAGCMLMFYNDLNMLKNQKNL